MPSPDDLRLQDERKIAPLMTDDWTSLIGKSRRAVSKSRAGAPLVWLVRGIRHFIWIIRGRPPGDQFGFFKRDRIFRVAERYGCDTLLETGTHFGETVAAARRRFRKVISIELSPELYEGNARRFRRANNVELFKGDSGVLMPQILARLEGRILFWLDGHYSGPGTARGSIDSPIIAELRAIAARGKSDDCVLIDDARCFGQDDGYPSLDEIRRLLRTINPRYEIVVENDCVVALPAEAEDKPSASSAAEHRS